MTVSDHTRAALADLIARLFAIDPGLVPMAVEAIEAAAPNLDPLAKLTLELVRTYEYFRARGYGDATLFLTPLLGPDDTRRELAATALALFEANRTFYGDDAEQLRALEQAIEAVE